MTTDRGDEKVELAKTDSKNNSARSKNIGDSNTDADDRMRSVEPLYKTTVQTHKIMPVKTEVVIEDPKEMNDSVDHLNLNQ